ncbi:MULTISPECIES: FkbM family methyltransferase [unclassified Ensifer]|uniref:FkbM family methyltransferase n=1 Tax=unclassified Ensifer TaxID=2633371 RepID=UPI0007130528|nr:MULTISPECIES: FkbM family methyltransferase [unclassified Ensifer]KQX58445.1 hypothetical protein ASD49_20445 [Ensifer sp. Root1298]KQX88490.1 hypothetical protein ASD41_27585 [Ensifer sp. Root1312]KRC22101.1 hypothetical protein ASE29_28260 [Ensifer sp. Root74]KRD74260.1 hypothetical protein ASE71_18425 [Ensifer sp. Root954]
MKGDLLTPADLLGQPTEVMAKVRERCFTSYLGDNTALCRVLGQFMMYLDTKDIGLGAHLMMNGAWEIGLTQFMVRIVKTGMRVADIGANFGYYSHLMSALIGPSGFCHSFEPNPHVARLLRQSLSINGFDGFSKVHEIALDDATGESPKFWIPDGEAKNACILDHVNEYFEARGQIITVPTSTFSEMDLGHLDFIKLDVEGAEYRVLMGMLHYMREYRPQLVAEINFGRNYDAKALVSEIAGLYGRSPRFVGDDGYAHEIEIGRMASENVGLDWLVYFSSHV